MKSFLKISLLCLVALAGNIATSFLAAVLHLPCFLDTIFSVAITFYAGLVPGLVVAVLFNPLMTVLRCAFTGAAFSFYDCLYALCGMLIVLTTWIIARNKKEFFFSKTITALYLLIIAFTSAFVSCFSASALDTFILPLFQTSTGFSSFDTFSQVLRQLKIGTFLSYLLPRIPLTVLDRLICTFAGFGIYRLVVKVQNHRMQKMNQNPQAPAKSNEEQNA